MLHCFSVDVEGFCEGMAESIPVPAGMVGGRAERREIEANVAHVLEWLASKRVRGTFFVLGRIAEQQPKLVRDIAEAGHEIGSHGHDHLRIYNLSPADAKRQVERSKQVLEDVSGKAILGFRAPDFSITNRNLHVLDSIREAGYTYDSSIVPVGFHDVYGVQGAHRGIHCLANGLLEFPPTTIRIANHIVPVLGGGYLRLTPSWAACMLTRHFQASGRPVMSYIHPYEIGPVHPEIPGLTWSRRFRHCANLECAQSRYSALFRHFRFAPAHAVLELHQLELARLANQPLALTPSHGSRIA